MGFYDERRYWYHLSSRLNKRGIFTLKPWGAERSIHREYDEPEGERICVSPTIAQCLTALPQSRVGFHIYKTFYKVKAKKPEHIFDVKITKEGWLTRPTKFVYIGTIDFKVMERELGNQFWPDNVACDYDSVDSSDALEDWKKLMPKIKKYTEILIGK